MRNFSRTPGTAAALLLALAASSVTIGYSAAAVPGTQNPVPLVNNPLVPDSTAPGGSDFTLTVNGTGFVSGSVVQWNGTGLATTFVSTSKLTAMVPAADIASAGTASVTVVNPSPGGGKSDAALFSVRVPFTAASFGYSSFEVDSQPNWVIAADLNLDGNPDLVTTLPRDFAIAVSMGNGDGTFQPPVPYIVGGAPSSVIAADLNNDGKLDLAITRQSEFLTVLLGNGDGTFQPQQFDFDLGSQGVFLAAGDFNKDGNLDVAIPLVSGKVAVLLGNGDGTFQPVLINDGGSDRAIAVAVGDFDRDGSLDLATSIFPDGSVAVLLGNGDGTFQSPVPYQVQFGPTSILAADFNRDGVLDLAVGSFVGGFSVLLGNGDGSFANHVDYETDLGNFGIVSVDLDGDGKLDIAVPDNSAVTTFLGRGDGTFARRSDFSTGEALNGIAVADFDADGKIDIISVHSTGNTLTLLKQVTSVLSRTYVKFGNVKVGTKSSRSVIMTNIGTKPITITGIVVAGDSKKAYKQTNTCGSKLGPGKNCKITIVFKPPFAIPYRHARVKVNDSVASQKIYLVGSGTK